MSTTWNGNYTPAQDDMWNLVADMRKQAILNNRVIPVYSTSERDGLASLAPDGIIPDGTVVVRMDQTTKGAMFDVFVDGDWVVGDTGILTSGVTITAGAYATVDSYSVTRTGPQVTARIDFTFTGDDMTVPESGNIADRGLFTIEPAYKPIWATYDMSYTQPGMATWFGRVDSGGVAALTHGVPGMTLEKNSELRLDGSWRIA